MGLLMEIGFSSKELSSVYFVIWICPPKLKIFSLMVSLKPPRIKNETIMIPKPSAILAIAIRVMVDENDLASDLVIRWEIKYAKFNAYRGKVNSISVNNKKFY